MTEGKNMEEYFNFFNTFDFRQFTTAVVQYG